MSLFNEKKTKSAIISSRNSEKKKTFQFVKSPKREINFWAPLKNLLQWIIGRRHFLNLVVLILNSYGGWRWSMSDVCQPLPASVLYV